MATMDELKTKLASKVIEAKSILNNKGKEDPFEALVMIDMIQRLSIDYLFKNEIQEILSNYLSTVINHDHLHLDLYKSSLHFRLLRQHGYLVPQDVLDQFKNKEEFKKEYGHDVSGLMELYEASLLSVQGENILDEARVLSTRCLEACLENLDQHGAKVVSCGLDHPFHTNLARFMSKDHINTNISYGNEWLQCFQDVATIDWDYVHSVHKNELSQISKWWEDLDLPKMVKDRRKQPLQWHLWSVSCLPDPTLSELRMDLTKSVFLTYVMDDIFDVFGTFSELTLLADIMKRWDYDSIKQLPDYMKVCFETLDNLINEISQKVLKKHGWNPVDSLRKTWADLCQAYMLETIWHTSGEYPDAKEYLKNASISSGVHVGLVLLFFLLGQSITKETVQLIDDNPAIITSMADILRLSNDLEEGRHDENDISYVKCYMKENEGSTVDEARKEIRSMISDSWKNLNQECFYTDCFPLDFKTGTLNLARIVPLMYNFDDKACLMGPRDYMKSLF